MITYKLGTEVDKKDIHKAFHMGFIDYIMKVDIPEQVFFKRFFGPEGNAFDLSVVAYDGNEPVGLLLGGIKPFDGGALTMRCGGLCVVPEFRGKGISQTLMNMHREMAVSRGCKQIMLEVIGGNDRAIQFYKKIGYHVIYQLDYYSIQGKELKAGKLTNALVVDIELDQMDSVKEWISDTHVNWQNDFEYISRLDGIVKYGIFENEKLISFLIADRKGKVYLLWTQQDMRFKGYASYLLNHFQKTLEIEKIMMSFPNSATLTGFAKKVGFVKDELYQYEMYGCLLFHKRLK